MRAFIAVPVPLTDPLRQLFARLAGPRSSKTVSHAGLHVTLKFLGETREDQLPDIQREIDHAVSDEPCFEAKLHGLGAFPTPQRPSVVWVGMQNADPLCHLAERLETGCESLGFAKNARAFTPHLTVMRFKHHPPDHVRECLQSEADADYGPLPVDSIVLYESNLQPGGPIYTALSSHQLRRVATPGEPGGVSPRTR